MLQLSNSVKIAIVDENSKSFTFKELNEQVDIIRNIFEVLTEISDD